MGLVQRLAGGTSCGKEKAGIKSEIHRNQGVKDDTDFSNEMQAGS